MEESGAGGIGKQLILFHLGQLLEMGGCCCCSSGYKSEASKYWAGQHGQGAG